MHNIIMREYPENVNKKTVQEELDTYAAMEDWQEGCTGVSPIRWLDETYNTRDEAEDAIERLDRGWYDSLAVKFIVPNKNSSIKKCEERVKTTMQSYRDLKAKLANDFLTTKSEYVGCKKCGSRLSKKYLHNVICPLCSNTLLSETANNRISNAENKYKEAKKRLKEECSKSSKTKGGKKLWLVKTEYHT